MRGLIQQSDCGTLFLDEIGDMPLQLQSRLLRVLSEKEVVPIGGDKPIPVELTVVAASNRDLRRLIGDGVFREDLYYRLCGATLLLPPLRERDDRSYVISRVLEQEGAQMGVDAEISDKAMALFLAFAWPGNIRQLRNVIRYALAVCENGFIDVEDLPQELDVDFLESTTPEQPPAVAGVRGMSKSMVPVPSELSPDAVRLVEVLRRHRWNITSVSSELGVCRATVYRKMKRLNIISPTHL
jgi:transcriptional regulator of acetoin/glycerol metabolism